MAKSRYSKLDFGSTGNFRSTVGSVVIADYADPANGHRILVLERQQSGKAPKRKSNAKSATAQVIGGGTRFDTSEAGL